MTARIQHHAGRRRGGYCNPPEGTGQGIRRLKPCGRRGESNRRRLVAGTSRENCAGIGSGVSTTELRQDRLTLSRTWVSLDPTSRGLGGPADAPDQTTMPTLAKTADGRIGLPAGQEARRCGLLRDRVHSRRLHREADHLGGATTPFQGLQIRHCAIALRHRDRSGTCSIDEPIGGPGRPSAWCALLRSGARPPVVAHSDLRWFVGGQDLPWAER